MNSIVHKILACISKDIHAFLVATTLVGTYLWTCSQVCELSMYAFIILLKLSK